MTIQQVLEHIGLTGSESKVYLALVAHGTMSAAKILEKAKLNSGRIYDILTSLQQKGLVSITKTSKGQQFSAAPPETLLSFIEKQKETINEQEKQLTKNLSNIQKLYESNKEDIAVHHFIGIKGMRAAYELFFSYSKYKQLDVFGILPTKTYAKEFLDLLYYYVYKQRKSKKLLVRKVIDEKARKDKELLQDKSQVRYTTLSSLTTIEILGPAVLIIMPKEPYVSILIIDQRIADDHREQFDYLWNASKQ